MKLTSKMEAAGEMAVREMSKKAQKLYNGTDPLHVYEYGEHGNKRYSVRGALGDCDDMTFEELEQMFEEDYDEYWIEED